MKLGKTKGLTEAAIILPKKFLRCKLFLIIILLDVRLVSDENQN